MDKKSKKLNKSINYKKDTNKSHIAPQDSQLQKKENIKSILMDKYNLSEKEAEIIFKKLELKLKNEKNKSSSKNTSFQQKRINKERTNTGKNRKLEINNGKTGIAPNKDENLKINNKENKKRPINRISETEEIQAQNNVDNILSDIVPDYNKQISIEVKNVNLTFTISVEKVDTIKETIVNLFKRKKTEKIKIEALKNISFKVFKGEKVGIIGYNGAGKSTLLHVICGAYVPDEGEVITYGKISPLLGLGAGFDTNYSGRKNIFFNGAALGYDKKLLEEKEQEIIEFSELGEFIDIPIKSYSSGMLAKLGFSIATIVSPDILIIDEILGVGDVNFAKKSKDKMKSLMDGGTTVILVSHSIPTIRETCDRVIWLEDGKIKEMGEVNKICDHYLKAAEKATHQQLANIQLK